MIYIFLFSFEYQILGMGMINEAEDYPYIDDNLGYFIQTFRNSLGDLQVPGMEFWLDNHKDSVMSRIMIYLIWFMWIINKVLMLIVLLNFLIAIIS